MSKKLSEKNCITKDGFIISTPIGLLEVTSCTQGLHSLNFKKFQPNFASDIQILTKDPSQPVVQLENYLTTYFSKTVEEIPEPCICWKGVCKQGSFSDKILKTLLTVRFGERITYKELATKAGHVNSQRAVGTVMSRNPICLVIPCHRVINANNKIGNYSGGVEIKQWLLDFEKK